MTASPFTCVLDARAKLGECPTWSVAEQALYWVDIDAPALNRYDPSTGAKPDRLTWALCLTVKSVELDDAASPAAQVGVAVERACRPFATGSSRAERATPTEVVQRVRSGQW